MLEVVKLQRDEEGAYEAWLQTVETSMVYYALSFHRFLQTAAGGDCQVLLAKRGGVIEGAIPYFRKNDPGLGTLINSLPWYGSHGGCVLAADAPPGTRERLLKAYRAQVEEPDVLSATLILSPFEEEFLEQYRASLSPIAEDVRIGQITPLPENGPGLEQRLERVFTQKTRNLVRKALKQGFQRVCEDTDASWRLLHETHVINMQVVGGKAKPWEHFAALRERLPAEWREVSVATLNDMPVAALLLLRFNRTVEYFTPVVRHEFRPRQPLSFLIWHAMLDSVRRGLRWWNWGGTWTGQTSLHHFKAGWGAVSRPYTYLVSARPGAVHTIRERRDEVASAFPYYFAYPYSLLA